MPIALTATPIPYDASVERIDDDERETTLEIDQTMAKIREKTYADSGHAIRSVHAKSLGLLRGELRVLAGLPPQLAQGLFAVAKSYPVVLRFSTVPGDIVDDAVSTPRGLALKVVGVEGERLDGSKGDVTQDFVLVDGKAFNAPNPKKFLSSLKQLAATTDKAEGAKKALSATLQVAEKGVEAFGAKSAKLISMGGHAETNPLGETYFSQTPLRYGTYMAKVAVAPVAPALAALKDAKVDLADRPNGLRDEIVSFFTGHGGEWELQVQLCTDLEAMPVEDPSVEWPEEQSAYVGVARIAVAPQTAWSAARAAAVDDAMSFSPWHGLAAHRPLGAVNRARRQAYESSARFRAQQNGRAIAEPRDLSDLPD